jgi:hypothetical protein
MRSLRESTRGVGLAWGIIGLIALITLAVSFIFYPAFFLAVIIAMAGFLVLVLYKAHPYGLAVGVVLIIMAVVLGLAGTAAQLSLSVVHNTPLVGH